MSIVGSLFDAPACSSWLSIPSFWSDEKLLGVTGELVSPRSWYKELDTGSGKLLPSALCCVDRAFGKLLLSTDPNPPNP